jgi:hypothetical protein
MARIKQTCSVQGFCYKTVKNVHREGGGGREGSRWPSLTNVRGQIFICEYLANSALCKLFELHTDCAEGLIEGARIIWLRVLQIAAVPPAKTNFSGKK